MVFIGRVALLEVGTLFFLLMHTWCANGQTVCGAPTPKWVPEGEYFAREQNIPSYTACCHLCNVTATCRSYAYLRVGQTCDLYISERLVEHVNVNITGGLILPDGWVSPPPEPTTSNPDPCPINDPGSVRPHPSDCSKFLRCLLGHVYEDNCVAGLWFHMFWLNCTYADRVVCYGNSTASPDPSTTTPLPTTTALATTIITTTAPTTTTNIPTTTIRTTTTTTTTIPTTTTTTTTPTTTTPTTTTNAPTTTTPTITATTPTTTAPTTTPTTTTTTTTPTTTTPTTTTTTPTTATTTTATTTTTTPTTITTTLTSTVATQTSTATTSHPVPTPSPACKTDCTGSDIGRIANLDSCFFYHDCIFGNIEAAVRCSPGQMYDCGLRSCTPEDSAQCSDYSR